MVTEIKTVVSFWDTDWGKIIKIALAAIAIAGTCGLGYAFVRRNRQLRPQRDINMDLARKLSDRTLPLINAHPDKTVTTWVSVSNKDAGYGTEVGVMRTSDEGAPLEFVV